jgi:phage terminase large subunit
LGVQTATADDVDLYPEFATLEKRGGFAQLVADNRRSHEINLYGPYNCVAGETRIYDPDTGNYVAIEDYYVAETSPTVLTRYGKAKATPPFIKGIANLYRVTLENGNSFIATLGHRVLTPEGWRAIASLSYGDAVCTYSPIPSMSNSDAYPSKFCVGDRRFDGTTSNCQGGYSAYCHQCDAQLQRVLNSDPIAVPLQGDVLAYNRDGYNSDGHQLLPAHSHFCQLYDHPSNYRDVLGDARYFANLGYAEYPPVQYTPVHEFGLCQRLLQSQLTLHRPQPFDELTYHSFDKPIGEPLENLSLLFERYPNYTVPVSTIASIEFVRNDYYYDLHVPGYEHYLAEGSWHHNTGKTYGALVWFHWLMCNTPNAKGLWVRDTYNNLINSACETFERKVLPLPPEHPDSPVQVFGGERPQRYLYSNGGEILLGGLDKPGKFLSAEFDYIYINQVEDIPLTAYEMLTARADGRAGNTIHPQVLSDCNPSYPGHWLLARHSVGDLEMFEQLHIHNPMLYDSAGNLTGRGREVMTNLNKLTGIRRQRGLEGLWVAAEGAIYDNFSYAENVTEAAEYNPDLPVFWGVDDGYAEGGGLGTPGYHPRAFVLANQRNDGGFNIFAEYYKTLQLPEASINEVMSWSYHEPDLALVDSSAAELRRRLTDKDIFNGAASHRVADGIKVVRRFLCDGSGKRSLHIHPRCKNLIRELQGYRYDDKFSSSEAGEPKPLKIDDHLVDALRYLLFNFR